LADVRNEYERVRTQHAAKKGPKLVSIAAARANRPKIDWASYRPPRPSFIGRREFRRYDLAEIARYVDWGPFFQAWDLHGGYPALLDDPLVGESARRVFADGQAMMKRIVDERWLEANGVVAFLPANSVNDDDIEVYTDETRSQV